MNTPINPAVSLRETDGDLYNPDTLAALKNEGGAPAGFFGDFNGSKGAWYAPQSWMRDFTTACELGARWKTGARFSDSKYPPTWGIWGSQNKFFMYQLDPDWYPPERATNV